MQPGTSMDRRLAGLLCVLPAMLLLLMSGSAGAQTSDDELVCFNFTWTGKNISVDCDDHMVDIMGESQPCQHTLVYTDPPDLKPNLTDLIQHCTTVAKCPSYTCKTKTQKCLQIMWYDITNTMVNYSSFCGVVTDVTDPSKRKSVGNTMLEMEVGTHTKKLKVCDTKLCNAARPAQASPGTLVMMVLALLVARLGLGAGRGDG